MANQVDWTRDRLDLFIEKAMLSKDEIYIMTSRIQDTTPVSQQAIHLHCSESKVHYMIRELKRKYDIVQKEVNDPKKLPPRRESAKERYMDTH